MAADGSLGRISISTAAIAQVVAYVAPECFGVVALAGRGGRVGRLVLGDAPTRGVEVVQSDRGLVVTVHVIVEHGVNLAEAAATIRTRTAYEVGRLTGLEVASVDVDIADVRATA